MKKHLLAILLCAGTINLYAANATGGDSQIPTPKAMEAANQEIRANSKPQNVFAKPILNPAANLSHGEPAIAWHNGEYFFIYDNLAQGGREGGPLCLMTSKDGVYWREEGIAVDNEIDTKPIAIACADVRRFDPKGPFVLSYDVKQDGVDWQTWFSTSHDLRHWTRVPDVELIRDPKLYNPARSYVRYSIPAPDGKGFYAVGAYSPVDCMGVGLLRSENGIHWEQLPAARVDGVVDQRRGGGGPNGKALESSGIIKLEGRYFIGGYSWNAEFIVTSRNIEGPYSPTPKNSIHLDGPMHFHRYYDLPGGYLSMPMIWVHVGGKGYRVAPFRRVVSDGESLWFKWWEGNEKMKVHPLAISLQADKNTGSGLRMSNECFDVTKGLVLEGTVALPAGTGSATNLALPQKSQPAMLCLGLGGRPIISHPGRLWTDGKRLGGEEGQRPARGPSAMVWMVGKLRNLPCISIWTWVSYVPSAPFGSDC